MAEELWREVWREGFLPSLPAEGLAALRDALQSDDERVIQGATTSPPPLQCTCDWDIEASCPVTYCGWKGQGLGSVREAENFFGRACRECDERMGSVAACRWFLNWWDETPRQQARRLLLEEVERSIESRDVRQQTAGRRQT